MKNLSLRNKLFLTAAIIISIIATLQILGGISLSRLTNRYDDATTIYLPSVTAFEEIKFAGSRLISSTNESLLDSSLNLEESSQEEVEEVEEAIEDYNTALENLRILLVARDAEHAIIFEEVEESGNHLVELFTTILELQESKASVEEIAEVREELEEAEEEFLQIIEDSLLHEQEELLNANNQVDNDLRLSLVALGLYAIILLFVILSLIYWLYQSVSRPISNLRQVAVALQAGDLGQRIQAPSSDEIGILGQAFNQMAESIQDQVRVLEIAKDEAERSNQVKSAFLASMSHELRTPLNAIINFTTFVSEGDLGTVNEDQKETLHQVITSSKHLLSLINDVLDMSKIEAGSLRLFVVDDINLTNILEHVQGIGESLVKDKPVQIEVHLPADLPLIRGDRQRIEQIFLNIMSNACKFTEEGKITLHASQNDETILVSIKDTGPGIAEEEHIQVFESFKQTHTGLRQGSGTGLGMPISKSLAEAHGGKLWFESRAGEGSTFSVVLPIKNPELAPILRTPQH